MLLHFSDPKFISLHLDHLHGYLDKHVWPSERLTRALERACIDNLKKDPDAYTTALHKLISYETQFSASLPRRQLAWDGEFWKQKLLKYPFLERYLVDHTTSKDNTYRQFIA